MIGAINFLGNIQTNYGEKRASNPALKPMEHDCFVKSTEGEKAKTLREAKEKIINKIIEENTEYGYTISPEGEILEEYGGDEHSCTLDSRKIVPHAILMHGHPSPLPLSSGDIAILLATPADSQEAITRDGKFSKLTKKYPINNEKSYRDLYFELEKMLCLMALDKMGIDYKLNKDDIAQMGRDYIEYQTGQNFENEDSSEVLKRLENLGIDTSKSNEEIAAKLKELMFLQLLTNPQKYDKEHKTIIENMQSIHDFLDSEEGTRTRHEFVQNIARAYDLNYETNLD